jgi:hypothetical protein
MTLRCGLRRTLVAAAGTTAFVGCGSDEASTKKATPAATKAAAAAVPDDLAGTWVRTLTPPGPSYLDAGTYTLKVLADGNVEAYFAGSKPAKPCLTQELCEGFTVEARAGKLAIGETLDCVSPGDYTFKVTGDTLKTRQVKDDCGSTNDRPQLFAGATWRRRGS